MRLFDRIDVHAAACATSGVSEDARRLWDEALPLARALERRGVPETSGNVAVALANLALVLSDLGQHDDAASYGSQAVDINRRLVEQRSGGDSSSRQSWDEPEKLGRSSFRTGTT